MLRTIDEILGGKLERFPAARRVYRNAMIGLGAVATVLVLVYVLRHPGRGGGRVVAGVPLVFFVGYISPYLLAVCSGVTAQYWIMSEVKDFSAWRWQVLLLAVMTFCLWRAAVLLPAKYKYLGDTKPSAPAAPWWALLAGALAVAGIAAVGGWWLYIKE
ncbi:MAG: hypothetical protein NTV51_18130 [Verrucomicrobia bacterium]|nr:hypothetical protein [Verrucomicrobiota bacterium]